jgi:hypothetical protein
MLRKDDTTSQGEINNITNDLQVSRDKLFFTKYANNIHSLFHKDSNKTVTIFTVFKVLRIATITV